MNPDDLTLVARHVMKLLVERRFDELEAAARGEGLSADDMEAALGEAGATPVMPPEAAWRDLRARAVRHMPGAFDITLALWAKGGRTGATVELAVRVRDGRPVAVVEDIIPG